MLKIDVMWQRVDKDARLKRAALKAARKAAKREKKSGSVSRITSYNVCYTKLLRFPPGQHSS